MVSMLRAVIVKGDSIQEHVGNVSSNVKILRKAKRNAKNQTHCNINEKCVLDELTGRLARLRKESLSLQIHQYISSNAEKERGKTTK